MTKNDQAGRRMYFPLLDFVRIFAFCLIIYQHLMSIEQKYFADTVLSEGVVAGFFGVDIFFILSGFMMGRLFLAVPLAKRKSAWVFLVERVSRIYPLYWLVTSVIVVVYLWRPDLVYSSRSHVDPNLLKTYLLWPDNALPLHAVAWTLTHLMYFNIVTALMFLVKPRFYVFPLVLWAAGTVIAHRYWSSSPVPELALIGNVFTLDYILGLVLGLLPALSWKTSKYLAILGLLGLVGALFAAIVDDELVRGGGYKRFLMICPASAVLIYAIASYVRPMKTDRGPLSLPAIARAGFAFYLTHVISFSLMGRVYQRFDQPGIWDNVIVLSLMVVLSFAASMVIERYVETPLSSFLKRLLIPVKQTTPA